MLKSNSLRSTLALAAIVLSAGIPVFAADIPMPIAAGKSVTIGATADGSKPMRLEIYKDDVKVFEAVDTASYIIPSLSATDAGAYWAKAFNDFGNATSTDRIIVSVGTPPSPPVMTVTVGGVRMVSKKSNVKFIASIANGGGGSTTYQWTKNGQELYGETGPELNLYQVNPSYDGRYAVIVRQGTSTAVSPPAQLWVLKG
jgi:hypothetical protein